MVTGTVKILYESEGFALVVPDSGAYDIVVQAILLQRLGLGLLEQGQRVRCSVEADRHGRASATHIALL